jgi:hypothetical protein
VTGNTADTTLQLFLFSRMGGLRPAGWDPEHKPPADPAVEFHDNLFEANAFSNPTSNLGSASIPLWGGMLYSPGTGTQQPVPGTRDPGPDGVNFFDNTFRNNRFGTSRPAPSFGIAPLSGAVVEGGGNQCGALPSNPYPLVCGP